MRKLTLTFFAAIAFLCSQAQCDTATMIKEWMRAKAYTLEYLEAMPADKYDLKPTADMRSFAQQMLHFTDANFGFASAISGIKSPVGFGEAEKATDQSKANVIKLVSDGYDFVIASIRATKPEDMATKIKMFGRFEMTKGEAFAKAFEHQTHHRGQTTVYIRLAGAKPPQEKLF